MSESLNKMKKSIKDFVQEKIAEKNEYGGYIYVNSLNENKLKGVDLLLRKQKMKINNYKGLSEQMFIHYGCLIYKNGYEQDKIENIFSYFKEVDYLVRNYNVNYFCLSNELKILKESVEFIHTKEKKFSNNIKKFLYRGGYKPLDCLTSLLSESETNPLLKEIYFFHNYVERGFDAAVTKTIISNIYKESASFVDELKECKELLNETSFRINLHYIKECMLYYRNIELNIIKKYGYEKREDFITDLSKTVKVLKSFCDGVINENNIIHDDLIKWLDKKKPKECFSIESVKDILKEEVSYYDEKNQSIPYLPNSLFRLDEKIKKISDYVDALEGLSHENRVLLQMQERIAQTLVFGIETLDEKEKESLINDIDRLLIVYEEMKKEHYGIQQETKKLFEKKEFGLKSLKDALSYIRLERLSVGD